MSCEPIPASFKRPFKGREAGPAAVELDPLMQRPSALYRETEACRAAVLDIDRQMDALTEDARQVLSDRVPGLSLRVVTQTAGSTPDTGTPPGRGLYWRLQQRLGRRVLTQTRQSLLDLDTEQPETGCRAIVVLMLPPELQRALARIEHRALALTGARRCLLIKLRTLAECIEVQERWRTPGR